MAERGLGYTEAPADMFANDAGVIENGQGAQFRSVFFSAKANGAQFESDPISASGNQFGAELSGSNARGAQFDADFSKKDAKPTQFLSSIFTEEGDMTDFNGAKPVMTVRDNEFKVSLVDGASGSSATNKLSIVASGDSLTSKFGVVVFGVDNSGNAVSIPVGTNGVKVEASDLDIRDLVFATDKVDVSGSSVTVSATDLDIRDLAFATDKVDVSGSEVSLDSATLAALENITVSATDLDIRDLAFATDKVDVSGSEVSLDSATLAALEDITVSATDLDIRDLSHASDSVKIGDGTDFLAVNTDGSINVNVTLPGGKVCDYKTSATVGVGAEVIHMYPVTSGKKFSGNSILVGARGAVKVRFGLSTDGIAMSTVKGVYFQDPKENCDHEIDCLELLGDGTKAIAVGITNLDGQSSDVYSTLQGYEN